MSYSGLYTLILLGLLGLGSCLPEKSTDTSGGEFTQLFVSTEGDDENPGTRSKPWRTIAKGINSIRPGEMLVIRSGTYEEEIDIC